MTSDSIYDDEAAIADEVGRGRHREIVGGLWDEIGTLQFEFLRAQGLSPNDHLLDIGCGSLRGGVHFAAYLEPGHYWGIDANASLLEAGYAIELAKLGLTDRVPRSNLLHDGEFDLARFGQTFDAAIAQSLFTHLSQNRIRLCLFRLAKVVRSGGRLFATYFECPENHPFEDSLLHPNGVRTFGHKDPFHYRLSDMEAMLADLPWRLVWAKDWDHPRDQKIMILERVLDAASGEASPDSAIRQMSTSKARSLPPGAPHYRAYVGPPDRYDFIGASQFALLFALGLRDRHSVLDFGCGSLRLGRLLIPYLEPDGYFGIDPNRWLIEDGLSRELGWSAVRLKRPAFAYNDDFRCDVFGRRFDFVVAQSILTHCGRGLTQLLLKQIAAALEPAGLAIFSIIEAAELRAESHREGWIYPDCVGYYSETILQWCRDVGLTGQRLPWYHPGATWYLAARDPARVPTLAEMPVLTGSVLFDPQFAAGRPPRITDATPAHGPEARPQGLST